MGSCLGKSKLSSQVPVGNRVIEKVSPGSVEDFYEIGKELGKGTFSVVRLGIHKKTKQTFAIKFISKDFVDQDDIILLSREIDIMKQVDHENVLRLIEIFENEKYISLVMELVEGGELFFQIIDRGSYSERDAANIVYQIVNGVKYLHSLGIAHRDLKPENLLCTTNSQDSVIKIADFGLSKIFAGGQALETSCGTPMYAAPEVLIGKSTYDSSVDLWSVGVITYVLLCGYPPFYAKSQTALFEKVIAGDYDFPEPEWLFISDTAKDFIKGLIVVDSKKRMTPDMCLQHPFLAGAAGTQELDLKSFKEYNAERKRQLELRRQNSNDFLDLV